MENPVYSRQALQGKIVFKPDQPIHTQWKGIDIHYALLLSEAL